MGERLGKGSIEQLAGPKEGIVSDGVLCVTRLDDFMLSGSLSLFLHPQVVPAVCTAPCRDSSLFSQRRCCIVHSFTVHTLALTLNCFKGNLLTRTVCQEGRDVAQTC